MDQFRFYTFHPIELPEILYLGVYQLGHHPLPQPRLDMYLYQLSNMMKKKIFFRGICMRAFYDAEECVCKIWVISIFQNI